jgi:hypothetical protein
LSVCAKAFYKSRQFSKTKNQEVLSMKHMQDFREWLSAANAASESHQRRLAALTHIDRVQLSNVSSELSWLKWEAL